MSFHPFRPLDRIANRQLRGNAALWEMAHEQSHMHHALIMVIFAGGLSMVAFAIFGGVMNARAGRWDSGLALALFARPLAIGCFVGMGLYVVREIFQRINGAPRDLWDGFLDVFLGFTIFGPWALVALTSGVPWWTGAALWFSSGLVALLYSFWRPRGRFLYDADEVMRAAALLNAVGAHAYTEGDYDRQNECWRLADVLSLVGSGKPRAFVN